MTLEEFYNAALTRAQDINSRRSDWDYFWWVHSAIGEWEDWIERSQAPSGG